MRRHPTHRFQVGDKVFDRRYGFGVVKKVDPKDRYYPYYVEYNDGTHIWYRADHAVPASEARTAQAADAANQS